MLHISIMLKIQISFLAQRHHYLYINPFRLHLHMLFRQCKIVLMMLVQQKYEHILRTQVQRIIRIKCKLNLVFASFVFLNILLRYALPSQAKMQNYKICLHTFIYKEITKLQRLHPYISLMIGILVLLFKSWSLLLRETLQENFL